MKGKMQNQKYDEIYNDYVNGNLSDMARKMRNLKKKQIVGLSNHLLDGVYETAPKHYKSFMQTAERII